MLGEIRLLVEPVGADVAPEHEVAARAARVLDRHRVDRARRATGPRVRRHDARARPDLRRAPSRAPRPGADRAAARGPPAGDRSRTWPSASSWTVTCRVTERSRVRCADGRRARRDVGPFGRDDREDRRVAQQSGLARACDGCQLRSTASNCAPTPSIAARRTRVARVGLQVHPSDVPHFERVGEEQQLRLDVDPAALRRLREPGAADLDRVRAARRSVCHRR